MYNKRIKIRLIVKELRKGTYYYDAIHNAGIKSGETVRIWRTRPQKFSRYWHQRCDTLMTRAWKMAEEKRVDFVEKALMKKLLSGEAHAAEYVFFLCNRAPERWRHVQTITNANIVTVKNESIQNQQNLHTEYTDEAKYVNALEEKDLDALCERFIEKRKDAVSAV